MFVTNKRLQLGLLRIALCALHALSAMAQLLALGEQEIRQLVHLARVAQELRSIPTRTPYIKCNVAILQSFEVLRSQPPITPTDMSIVLKCRVAVVKSSVVSVLPFFGAKAI